MKTPSTENSPTWPPQAPAPTPAPAVEPAPTVEPGPELTAEPAPTPVPAPTPKPAPAAELTPPPAPAPTPNDAHPLRRAGHMDSFKLKLLAIIGMTANHTADILGPLMPWQVTFVLFCFGGMTFATMAFLMVEGYLHTSSLKRYALRLFVFALISQIPFSLSFGARANVMFTLLLGLGLLWAWDNIRNRGAFLLIFLGATCISFFCDWALTGPMMVFLFYVLRDKGTRGILLTMLVPYVFTIARALISLIPEAQNGLSQGALAVEQDVVESYRVIFLVGVPILLTGPLLQSAANLGYALVGYTIATTCICHYNGQRGRPLKWFFYAYYPAHLLVLWGIKQLLVTVTF